MSYIAHTPPKDFPDVKPHLYAKHIDEALKYGTELFNYLSSFSASHDNEKEQLRQTLTAAIMLHDMGKLDEDNQKVFRGEIKGGLPVDHIEAGVAIATDMKNELLGWLIRGHHAPGLPSKKSEQYFINRLNKVTHYKFSPTCLRGKRNKRTKETAKHRDDYLKHFKVIEHTNDELDSYRNKQIQDCNIWPELSKTLPSNGIVTRLMLSCLVDSDHGSAAAYSKNELMPDFRLADTRWSERLISLNQYIKQLVKDCEAPKSKRNILRGKFYERCYSEDLLNSKLVMCSASVGLGKTTSVMAYLLRASIRDNSSRIIVIAPFSNIIDQTVNTLRKSIVLSGEDPNKVVVAHHHKADFSSKNMRQYAASWQAPIVVTTAVQFFETLASANPSKLRKLSSIVGASLFIDESHACLPVEFLKITWRWLKILSSEWGCNIIFSSGSMVEFWNEDSMTGDNVKLPELLPKEQGIIAKEEEAVRVQFCRHDKLQSVDSLIETLLNKLFWSDYLKELKPSCLIILNTVQSAAIVAHALSTKLNDETELLKEKVVLHLSTALAPIDRAIMLKEVERRQKNCEWDNKRWFLVATSCVEAGVDLDFSIGFRERCSITSFLQVAGRINRHGKRTTGILYDFSIIAEDGLIHHPGFKESTEVFLDLWDELLNKNTSLTELSTWAIRKEFSRNKNKKEISNSLLDDEINLNFQEVANNYKIINSETATVITSTALVKKLELGVPVDWQNIQENSVQLWINRINKLKLTTIQNCKNDEIYSWIDTYEYDAKFLGIMAGIINPESFFKNEGGVI